MALKSTIFKASLNVADMDRGYYADHALTVARHPSETDERMMVRILAFAWFADERLEFGRGISSEDEAALWLKDYTGQVEHWIEVGMPDEKILRKASPRSNRLTLLTYGGRPMEAWWAKEGATLSRIDKLQVWALEESQTQALARMAQRTMQLQATIQDGQIWLSDGQDTLLIEPKRLNGV